MKQLLPWNVTGIPPEARELARAAAARDGLSVGDWLTRRIYLESEQELQETRAASDPQDSESNPTEEMPGAQQAIMHQLARMEGATESALRRIDDTLRSLGRSSETTASVQDRGKNSDRIAENETGAAFQEQAQRMSHLTRRVENIERNADTATLRKALRGLHQGVSRLAEQAAKNEISTTNRIEALAGNIDSIARSAQETRAKTGHFAKDLEERLDALTEQIARSEDFLSGIEERVQNAVENRVATTERKMGRISEHLDGTERIRSAETRALENALESIKEEIRTIEKRNGETHSEIRRSVDEMKSRLDAAEHQTGAEADNDITANDDEAALSLPGMKQELVPGNKDQTVTNAVQRFLARARRSPSPTGETQPDAGGLSLASSRPGRTEDPNDDGGAPLRRILPVISLGILIATGIGFLIAGGALPGFGAGTRAAQAGTPSAEVSAVEAGTMAAQPLAASPFALNEGGTEPIEDAPASVPSGEQFAALDPQPPETDGQSTADPADAISSYMEAAQHGHRSAMHNLAVAYSNGVGIEKNLTEASRWFRSAADLGFVDSQFNLAVLYERGTGVPLSLDQAYKWYLTAAAQGDSEARNRAEELSAKLPEEQRMAIERSATMHGLPPNRAAEGLPTLAQLQ